MKSDRPAAKAKFLSCVALALLSGTPAAGPAPGAAAPATAPDAAAALASGVDRHVKNLAEGSEHDRQLAEDWLLNSPPGSLPLIEAASRRPGLDADARDRLTRVAERLRPLAKARLATEQRLREDWEWNQRTALDAYDRFGRHDPRWDEPARTGLRQIIARDTKERGAALGTLEHVTSDLKCDDPLVLYFDARALEVAANRNAPRAEQIKQVNATLGTYAAACEGFPKTRYPADRKCYALARAVLFAKTTTVEVQAPESKELDRRYANEALDLWPEAVKVPGIRPKLLLDLAGLVLDCQTQSGSDRGAVTEKMLAPLRQTFPDSPLPFLFQGRAYTQWAWDTRGGGYASEVKPKAWEPFANRLATACEALQKAYDLDRADPAIPVAMMYAQLGREGGRRAVDEWFRKAVEAAPDNVDRTAYPLNNNAYDWKLTSVLPRWYGSPEVMLAFGRECLATRNWRGSVTWMLVRAHEALADDYLHTVGPDENYWRQPQVWKDVASVVARQAEMWPEDDYSGSLYAYWAWKCGQWKTADAAFKRVGARLNPAPFGGAKRAEQARDESAAEAAAEG